MDRALGLLAALVLSGLIVLLGNLGWISFLGLRILFLEGFGLGLSLIRLLLVRTLSLWADLIFGGSCVLGWGLSILVGCLGCMFEQPACCLGLSACLMDSGQIKGLRIGFWMGRMAGGLLGRIPRGLSRFNFALALFFLTLKYFVKCSFILFDFFVYMRVPLLLCD